MGIWYFLGQVKKRIKRKIRDVRSFLNFLTNKIAPKTILIVEPNDCHTELFPSYVEYLKRLGYKIEIITFCTHKGFLPELNVKNIYYFTLDGVKSAFKLKKINAYEFIIFTSYRLYYKSPDKKREYSKVFEHFKMGKSLKAKTAVVVHHTEDIDDDINGTLGGIVLSEILKQDKFCVVNPCYFMNVAPKDKNIKTTFVAVGKLEHKRKNAGLLFDITRKLVSLNITDFQIIAIGDSTKDDVPKDLQEYIKPLGKLDFNSMYRVLSGVDFFLPLLDPEFCEHLRYITHGTSGSFQLIRGFLLPPLMHRFFCNKHRFNDTNALIYEDNEGFLETFKKAIDMKNDEYINLQNNLLAQSTEIQNKSIENLNTLLKEHCE